MVLRRKTADCSVQVELMTKAKEVKCLGVLFTSNGKMEQELYRQIGAASAEVVLGKSFGGIGTI